MKKRVILAIVFSLALLFSQTAFVFAQETLPQQCEVDANGKYAKYANLTSGILMVLLGALLLFRPEWLMFT